MSRWRNRNYERRFRLIRFRSWDLHHDTMGKRYAHAGLYRIWVRVPKAAKDNTGYVPHMAERLKDKIRMEPHYFDRFRVNKPLLKKGKKP